MIILLFLFKQLKERKKKNVPIRTLIKKGKESEAKKAIDISGENSISVCLSFKLCEEIRMGSFGC